MTTTVGILNDLRVNIKPTTQDIKKLNRGDFRGLRGLYPAGLQRNRLQAFATVAVAFF